MHLEGIKGFGRIRNNTSSFNRDTHLSTIFFEIFDTK